MTTRTIFKLRMGVQFRKRIDEDYRGYSVVPGSYNATNMQRRDLNSRHAATGLELTPAVPKSPLEDLSLAINCGIKVSRHGWL